LDISGENTTSGSISNGITGTMDAEPVEPFSDGSGDISSSIALKTSDSVSPASSGIASG